MKPLYLLAFLVLFSFYGCQEDETAGEFTGRLTTYQLVAGSGQDIEGTVTLKEKADHSTRVIIDMTPTGGSLLHPVHLHYGTMIPDADMAAMLHPVDGTNGRSVTDLSMLMDDTPITYEELLIFDGHIKVHLDDGPHKSVVIAYTNIGKNNDMPIDQR